MNEPTSRPPQGFEFKTLILKNKKEKNSNVSPKLTESAYNFFFLDNSIVGEGRFES